MKLTPFFYYFATLLGPLTVTASDAVVTPAMPATPAAPVDNAPPAPARVYSLTDFLDIVMKRSPAILSAELDVQSIDYARRAAQAAYFPKLEATGRTGYLKGVPISPFVNPATSQRNEGKADGFIDYGGGSLTIPVFTEGTFLGINTPPKVSIELAVKNVAAAKLVLTRDEIRFRAISVYLQAVVADKQSSLLRPKIAALQAQVRALQIRQNRHLASDMEVASAQSKMAEAGALSQQAQWLTASALIQVTQLLGLDDPRQVQIVSDFPELSSVPDYQTILTQTLLTHPALAAQQAQIAQADAQHALNQSAFLPKVDIQNSYEWGDNYSTPGQDRWLSALTVSVPIFDGGENYFKVRSASANLAAEKDRLYQVKLDLESELQGAYSAMEEANVDYAGRLVSVNQKYIELKRDEVLYGRSQIAMTDYLNAQIAYADAAFDSESSHFRLLLAYAGLEKMSSGAWKWQLAAQ